MGGNIYYCRKSQFIKDGVGILFEDSTPRGDEYGRELVCKAEGSEVATFKAGMSGGDDLAEIIETEISIR
jgi:hypothetical protein